MLNGFAGSASSILKACQGTLPKLEVQRGQKDVADYIVDARKLVSKRRSLVWQTVALAYVFAGASKTAADAAKAIAEAIAAFDLELVVAWERLRYIAAITDRKKNKVYDYGLFYSLDRFNSALDKDRAGMSASQVQDHVKELTKSAELAAKWREWFVAEVGDIPFHVAATAAVDEALAKFTSLFDPRAMAKEAAAAARGASVKHMAEEIERGKRRIAEALAEFARFPERAEEKYRTLNAQVETWERDYAAAIDAAGGSEDDISADAITKLREAACVRTAACAAWRSELADATARWRQDEALRLLERAASDELRECRSRLNTAWDLVDHYRTEEAIVKLQDAVDAVAELKRRPGFLGLGIVAEFFPAYEKRKAEVELKIRDTLRNRKCGDLGRELRGALSQMEDLLGHYRQDEALVQYHKANEMRREIESLPRDHLEHEDTARALAEFHAKGPKFLKDYKDRVVHVQARDKVGDLSRVLGCAQDKVDHYREVECLEDLATVEERLGELSRDLMLGSAAQVLEFADECRVRVPALKAQANRQMLDREVHEVLRVLNGTYGDCEQNFSHSRFEMSLQSLAKLRELANELDREVRFRGRPDVEAALLKFDAAIPEFMQRYAKEMALRAFEEDRREARGAFGAATDMFQHSRFDECLAELHKARQRVAAIAANELYCDGGALNAQRDAFVKESLEVTVPEFLAKYTETVIARKAREAARELSGKIGTATSHLEHHRGELFLAALADAKEFAAGLNAADPDSEAAIVFRHAATTEALNDAARQVHELTERFRAQEFTKQVNEAMRNVTSPLADAKHLLGHSRFEDSLVALASAQAALSVLSLLPSADAAATVAKAQADIAAFRAEYSATMDKRRDDDLARAVNAALGAARSSSGCAMLVELAKARDAVDAFVQQQSPASAAAGGAGAKLVADWTAAMAALEAEYAERVLSREASDAIRAANTELSFAEDHFAHYRDEGALQSLSAAREAAAALAINTRIAALPAVVAFLAEFAAKQPGWNAKIEARMLDREVTEKVRELRGQLGALKAAFDHHQNEIAAELYNKVQETAASFTSAARYAAQPEVIAVASESRASVASFLADYRERVIGSKFVALERDAESKRRDAVDQLGRCNFTASIQGYSEAVDLCGQIGGEPLLFGYDAAEKFIAAFAPKLDALRLEIAQKQKQRAVDDTARDVASAMNQAKDDFDHHRDEMSLAQLNRARDLLQAYEAEFGADAFTAAQKAAQVAFESAYAARVFESELSRRERKIRERRAACSDAFAHHRHEEATRALAEADEACADLGTDARFLHLPRVSAFIAEHVAAAAGLRAEIRRVLRERADAEATRAIADAMARAEDLYAHFRFEESLAAVTKAAELVDEAAENKNNNNSSNNTATAMAGYLARIAAFKAKYQQERLELEIAAQVRGVRSLLDSARFLLNQHRLEECMAALAQAKEQATALNASLVDPASSASAAAFFAEWPTLFRTVDDAVRERLSSNRVRDSIAEVSAALHEAETCAGHRMHERALTASAQAQDLIRALREAPGPRHAVLDAFLNEAAFRCTATATKISDELFAREVDDILRAARGHAVQAEHLFGRCAFEGALHAFNAAKEVLDAATQDARLSASTALRTYASTAFLEFRTSFARRYADAVLSEEARKVAGSVRVHLGLCTLYLERNAREKCLEELAAAREAAAALTDEGSMLGSLDVAKAALLELLATRGRVASTLLLADGQRAIFAARKIAHRVVASAAKLLDCAADIALLREALEPLLGTDAVREPVAPLFAPLPEVVAFVTQEMAPVFATAGAQMFVSSSDSTTARRGTKAAAAGANAVEDPALLGKTIAGRVPRIAELRKGLPTISIGPDVHPRYFSALKECNQQYVNVKGELKDLEKYATALDLSGEPAAGLYGIGFARECEAIDRYLGYYAKALTGLEASLTADAAKSDAVFQQLSTGFDRFATAWAETKAHFANVERILKRFRALRHGRNVMLHCFEEALCVANAQSCSSAEFKGMYMESHMPFQWRDNCAVDYQFSCVPQSDMFAFIARTCVALISTLDGWAKEHADMVASTTGPPQPVATFPGADAFKKEMDKLRVEAKREHAQLCVRRIAAMGGHRDDDGLKSNVQSYCDALRRFPLARAEAIRWGVEIATTAEHTRYERPWFKSALVDPLEDCSVTPDEDESPAWYEQTWEWVLQDASSALTLPMDKKPDQSTKASADVYTATCKKNAGKIVFSSSLIKENGEGGAFSDKFDLKTATEGAGIFGRAFWPRSIANYPIAKDKKTGKVLYGPAGVDGDRLIADIYLKASIDGKEVTNECHADGCLSSFSQRRVANPGETDFYATSQTCRLRVLADDLDDVKQLGDPWHATAARFAYEFSLLAPGEHKVDLQLCFRLYSTHDNTLAHPVKDGKRVFPFSTTPVSAPIATGGFTLVVPTFKVPRRSILPRPVSLSATSPAARAQLEQAITAHLAADRGWGARKPKQEVPMYVTLVSDAAFVSSTELFVVGKDARGCIVCAREPMQYERDFRAAFRRRVKDGWQRERVAFFLLGACGVYQRGPPTDIPPITSISVALGSHLEVDARFLSEEDEKRVPSS